MLFIYNNTIVQADLGLFDLGECEPNVCINLAKCAVVSLAYEVILCGWKCTATEMACLNRSWQ